jgi:hypothetical protein
LITPRGRLKIRPPFHARYVRRKDARVSLKHFIFRILGYGVKLNANFLNIELKFLECKIFG